MANEMSAEREQGLWLAAQQVQSSDYATISIPAKELLQLIEAKRIAEDLAWGLHTLRYDRLDGFGTNEDKSIRALRAEGKIR